jgi:DNA-directed RNA polymerase I and III subunit RPAC2
MNMRLQTITETKEKVMNDGLKCLSQICDIIE